MTLGPIDAERANPPESVGRAQRRRGALDEEIPSVIPPGPVGDALQEEKQDAEQHAWEQNPYYEAPADEAHPLIDEFA